MIKREAELAKSECASFRRTAKDWVQVASSLDTEDAARSVRDLYRPPSLKKTVRRFGMALALAPEPLTTAAGVALVAGSFAMGGEPATLKSLGDELCHQMSELSGFNLADFMISFP